MASDELSSGFFGPDVLPSGQEVQAVQEIYCSSSGAARLLRGERYGRLHILKTLQPSYEGNEFYERALRKEFDISYGLEHPNICRTLGWERVDGIGQCILQEYVDGITLQAFMEQGKLTATLARKLLSELCDALQYIHNRQIVHRDLKPVNMLITHNGNNLKLIDFGLSDCDDYDLLKLPAGTRRYMAPEALLPDAPLDLRADIYSLGVIIGDMAERLKDRRLAKISRRCTRPRPEQRYASAAQVKAVLSEVPWLRRRSKPLFAAAVVAATLVVWLLVRWLSAPVVFPVYSNYPYAAACRQVLEEERLRLSRLTAPRSAETLQADSIRLMHHLETTLQAEYPLPAQRETALYRRQWQDLQQAAHALLGGDSLR